MGALEDNLDVLNASDESGGEWGRAATRDLVRSRIKVKSLNFMRGRTFVNKWLIIDEAQNLTPKQMKTLVTRAGPGTKVVCLGNIAQIDTPYLTEGSSGLTYVVDRMKDWAHAGHVTLARGERSRLADHAAEVLVAPSGISQAGWCFAIRPDVSATFRCPSFPRGSAMTSLVRARRRISLFAFAAPAVAQQFQPQVGQAGKDVIWVPTPDDVVERMLTMAQVTPNDYVCGPRRRRRQDRDHGGEEVRRARHRHRVQPGHGEARQRQRAGRRRRRHRPGKAIIRHGDIFATDFSSATVITLYLLPALNMKLRPQLLSMRPGTRVVSHSFSMEDWEADEISTHGRPPRLLLAGAGAT